ncbi:hypothetical protein COL922a_013923, partial [Colletotrichum nupharicola]
DPFKAPSKGDPKGKAPKLPTPTPTIPTIVRRKSAITLPTQPPVAFPTIEPTTTYDPRVENLTRQLTTLRHSYKGEHTRAEKYKAIVEEALDKVISL